MLIKMLCECRGSEDGYAVRLFRDGVIYDVAESLAREMVRLKHAVVVESLEDLPVLASEAV